MASLTFVPVPSLRRCGGMMRALARLLRARGGSARAAMVNRLLHDGRGALYAPAAAHMLEHELRYARDLLRELETPEEDR